MKNSFLVVLLLGFLAFKKTNNDAIIKGKLVHRSCASIVVQVLDANFYSLGQSSWQQSPSKPVYQHVFKVDDNCSFPLMEEGQEFTFKVLNNNTDRGNCYVCALFDNPPAKTQHIAVINKDGID